MDYKLNHLSNVKKELEITFSAEEVKENIQNAIFHLSKTVNIKGFRKGKVPLNVVKQMYGKSLKDDTENHFLAKAIQETSEKENLKFATAPEIFDKSKITEGEPFGFKYRVEIFPVVEIELKDFEAEYIPLKFKDEMVNQEMDSIKKRFIEFIEKDAAESDNKDRITINFSGKINDIEMDGTKGNSVPVILGEGKFVPDFEKALYGHKKGDNFNADVQFPDDYQAKELAGKKVTFTIEVLKIEKCEKEPEITDEFLKEKEGYPDTVEELKAELKTQIENYIESINLDNRKYIAIDTYVKNYEFDLPPSILKSEIDARVNEYKNKNNVETIEESVLEKINEESIWVVKRYIILSYLSEKLGINVTERDVTAMLEKEAVSYGLPVEYAEQLKKYYGEERLNAKKMEIREGKVLDKIEKTMKYTEKERIENGN